MARSLKSKKQDMQKELHDLRTERQYLLLNNSNFFLQEAYSALRTNVIFSLTDTAESRVILVTSSYQSEGKSYTSSNLAVSFAQAGKSVLLVDCDLRRPKIGRLMGLRSQAGLSNVLVNPQLFEAAAVPTTVPGLRVMLSGTIPPNPSELLGSQRMQEFLEEARRHFDYIIMDTSPVNMVSDAVMLSSFSDGVLFVVRAGSTDRRNVSRAMEQFRYANARVLGLVLNGAGSTGKSGYHRYQGAYAYKQGEK